MIFTKPNSPLINSLIIWALLFLSALNANETADTLFDIVMVTEDHEVSQHRLVYTYNQDGLKETKIIYDEAGIPISTTYYSYDYLGRLIKEVDIKGSGIEREYDAEGRILTETLYEQGEFLQQAQYEYSADGKLMHVEYLDHLEEETPLSYWEWMKEMVSAAAKKLSNFKETVSYTNYMQLEWEQMAEHLMTKSYLQFAGFYQDQTASGRTDYGTEINDKIRVTLINGILNMRADMDALLKIFSETHGNIPIHYVFRPTEGWTKDAITSSWSKMGFILAYTELLAKKWKSLIAEMGGVGNGGKIIHYAHSIGATDTYVARTLLTPEEREMIEVVTLGSPTMIPKDSGFAKAVNYVSKRDGVCFLDPYGYAMGYFYEDVEIKFIGTHYGIPLIDHTMYSDSYKGAITELGAQFVQTYVP